MKESFWALLLVLPVLNRETRPLAYLVALKFCAIYAFYVPFPAAPAIIDLMCAPLVIWGVSNSRQKWALMLLGIYALMMVAHGAHWSLWASGVYIGEQYYHVSFWLFTGLLLTFYAERGIVEFFRSIPWPSLPLGGHRSFVGSGEAWGSDREERPDFCYNRLPDVGTDKIVQIPSKEA